MQAVDFGRPILKIPTNRSGVARFVAGVLTDTWHPCHAGNPHASGVAKATDHMFVGSIGRWALRWRNQNIP